MSKRGLQHQTNALRDHGFELADMHAAFEELLEQGITFTPPEMQAGIESIREKRRLAEEKRRADPRYTTARKLLVEGKTIKEIEKIVGLPREMLYRWVREGFLNTD